ncbi:hypothetical protein [Winogradskyella alexanderae]|uniref:Cytochrome c n=1 Tax=Winogradskyella alexanderae TaxID=2877123 RepID=A0ABS7XUK0_9FLAO|nr:hypothetical protein [Winogradskyella alexanderae]MCA0133711.1 hypothetical protein [Winogradskyella alexanderae]
MAYFCNSRIVLIFGVLVFAFQSCKEQEKVEQKTVEKKVEYEMYTPSEMATFMNAMYAYNVQLKQQIIKGETPVVMPLDLMKMHTAEMSNGHGRTPVWNSFVNVFIEAQQSVADTLSNVDLKERYNDAINNCLACHKTECTGPIPKIKKLLIQ